MWVFLCRGRCIRYFTGSDVYYHPTFRLYMVRTSANSLTAIDHVNSLPSSCASSLTCSPCPSQSWHTICVTIRRVSSDNHREAVVLCACRSGWCSAEDRARPDSFLPNSVAMQETTPLSYGPSVSHRTIFSDADDNSFRVF